MDGSAALATILDRLLDGSVGCWLLRRLGLLGIRRFDLCSLVRLVIQSKHLNMRNRMSMLGMRRKHIHRYLDGASWRHLRCCVTLPLITYVDSQSDNHRHAFELALR